MLRIAILALILAGCQMALPEDEKVIESDVLNLEKDVLQSQINALKQSKRQ